MIEHIKTEVFGPKRVVSAIDGEIAVFDADGVFHDHAGTGDGKGEQWRRKGPLYWQPDLSESGFEEVLYFKRESPFTKYGCGLLWPVDPDDADAVDDPTDRGPLGTGSSEPEFSRHLDRKERNLRGGDFDEAISEDFDLSGTDLRHPSTMSVSICVEDGRDRALNICLPRMRRFWWQRNNSPEFLLNGYYQKAARQDSPNNSQEEVWRRHPISQNDIEVQIPFAEFNTGRTVCRRLTPEDHPLHLEVELYPRLMKISGKDRIIITVAVRNRKEVNADTLIWQKQQATLCQSYFEVSVLNGEFAPYPESLRPFEALDFEEQSLKLLYRDSACWAVGHGCAASWNSPGSSDAEGNSPQVVWADVMPAVELPSMTPDVTGDDGQPLVLSMRSLGNMDPRDVKDPGWESLTGLVDEYAIWIESQKKRIVGIPEHFRGVAQRQMEGCSRSLERMRTGLTCLKENPNALAAFRLANVAMLLQQIATKKITTRPLKPSGKGEVALVGDFVSPWDMFIANTGGSGIGNWRAFQAAFFLMSVVGIVDADSDDREILDLIWFPTGGGKTEAYLGVAAFYMFYQRLIGVQGGDGTNVLMRYTLRMLTTQQFQRAAGLICAMEVLRRKSDRLGDQIFLKTRIPGKKFSIGLWIGKGGSPNKKSDAREMVREFVRTGNANGANPLVLDRCPWCGAEIGFCKVGVGPRGHWEVRGIRSYGIDDEDGPVLHCSDPECEFGEEEEESLPVEVIDERIYEVAPSLVIGTADKFAILAYRPEAGAIFGRDFDSSGKPVQRYAPPGLIIQDELHLISGPLGTMYGFYEAVFERLCSTDLGEGRWCKPKLIASTATIRGAAEQVRALYGRTELSMFPAPALDIGDSFFGRYAANPDHSYSHGRLYLGVCAAEYRSLLTAQVRVFAAALYAAAQIPPESRDPWWTLLVFFNSLRELGGAKTLFDSDINARLGFLFKRAGEQGENRVPKVAPELSARLSQSELVQIMNQLGAGIPGNDSLDACLATNIIEVGLDIDRLSLMAVVGQPKTTSQYIQVTGRVGRRWWEKPGLVLTLFNPAKSRDVSHFEQFVGYHRRLYERVDPTSATPFADMAIRRALPGALLAWCRQFSNSDVNSFDKYEDAIEEGLKLLLARYALLAREGVTFDATAADVLKAAVEDLGKKWGAGNFADWEASYPEPGETYLMLWPGKHYSCIQNEHGVQVASSLRQVDASARLDVRN